jgi:hypothetical protein
MSLRDRGANSASSYALIAWLRTKYGIESPEVWLRQMSERLRCEAGEATPPISIEKIMRCRRARKEYVQDQEEEARLTTNETGFRIMLRNDLRTKIARQRFTLAHEIGHTLFYDLNYSPPRRELPRWYKNSYEETLCNSFAGELLVPEKELNKQYAIFNSASAPDRVKMFIKMAGLFQVGLQPMVIRCVQDLGWWRTIILGCVWLDKSDQFRSGEATWRIVWSCHDPVFTGRLFVPAVSKTGERVFPILPIKLTELLELDRNNGKRSGPFNIASKDCRLGNLQKILREFVGESAMGWFVNLTANRISQLAIPGYRPRKSDHILVIFSIPDNESRPPEEFGRQL